MIKVINKEIEKDYQLVVDNMTRIHEDCNTNVGVYGLVEANTNEIYYIGSTYSNSIRNRFLRYEQQGNGNSDYYFQRGHMYDFVRTLSKMLNNNLRYDDTYGGDSIKRYYLDYWWEKRERNDGLINWFKISMMLKNILKVGYVEVKPLMIMNGENWETVREKEIELIQQYQPYANMEFQLDSVERMKAHDKEMEFVYYMIEEREDFKLDRPIRVTYSIGCNQF